MIASNTVTVSEWSTIGPAEWSVLRGKTYDALQIPGDLIDRLNRSKVIRLTELRAGIEIQSRSHVGRLQLGSLTLIVRPKLSIEPLMRLLRYAFGLRKLQLFDALQHATDELSFEDLLIDQLVAEVQEILSRGVQKSYVPRNERLASPRGRIDIPQLARDGGLITAALPCRYHPRIEDTLLNRATKAGLRLAAGLASSTPLQRDCHRLESRMDELVQTVSLNRPLLDRADQSVTRLTKAYSSVLPLIRMLWEGQGLVLEGEPAPIRLPGFLFDMNFFFETLLGRFLRENLPHFEVVDQQGLKGMLRYVPGYRLPGRGVPTPRPDFIVKRQLRVLAVLDAKYRDLWERRLPREMLYQLIVYACSQTENPESAIVYPTNAVRPHEARIQVNDPLRGTRIGQVSLRPLSLELLDRLIETDDQVGMRKLAEQLAFGGPQPPLDDARPISEPQVAAAAARYRGRITDSLGLDDPKFTFDVTEAAVTRTLLKASWTENGNPASLDAQSIDGIRYEGTITYPKDMGNYRIQILRTNAADGTVVLCGHWQSLKYKARNSCLFTLTPDR